MSFGPLQPARIDFSDPGAPRSTDFDDVYHTRSGALGQARHVFLGGNGLPARWAGRRRFVVLETGFGLGNNFLATWAAWHDDPQRCEQLVFISVDKHPPRRADLARAHAASPLPELADALLLAWPPLTPDIHVIDLAQGRVRLLLVLADVAAALPEIVAGVDAFYLDGFAPAKNPQMWDRYRLRSLARLAAPDATLATWSVARDLHEGLASAGFALEKVQGFHGKREMTVGRFAPRFVPDPPPGRRSMAGAVDAEPVIVIGAGLAGAGVARALAMQGLDVDVIESRPGPAQATSGNAGGLFHGIVHGHDGAHARWLRAGALMAGAQVLPAIAAGQVPGGIGLLRGESGLSLAAMQALIREQALPPEWVQACSADQAAAQAGVPCPQPAWFYPGGGWVAPAVLVPHWLAAPRIRLRADCSVARLQRTESGWQLFDADGRHVASAMVLVLANANDAMRLLGGPAWPWQLQRGQVSLLGGDVPPLRLPLADQGYALPLGGGRLLCGASSQAGDAIDNDDRPRDMDHASNLATLQRLTGWAAADHAFTLEGRVGWRMQTADRLPLLGPVPDANNAADTLRADQPRFLPRQTGLYVATGYGSRGITHAALAGEVLAAWISGAPMPVPASLLDAVDPARFAARAQRKAQG